MLALTLAACRAEPAEQQQRFPAAHRPVSPIVGDSFSTEDARDRLGEAEQVMKLAGIQPGMWVLDGTLKAPNKFAFGNFYRITGVRDYSQAKIANDQNDVMKRLTVIASLLLVPTFIVGLYGQNFVNMPELHWHLGYLYSWGLIVVTTIGQLWFFKWKKWF